MKPLIAIKQPQASQQKRKDDTAPGAYDPRFRGLIGETEWASLPPAVQKRFSKRVAGACVVLYPGVITAARFSPAGQLFAQICRVIGGPLPLVAEAGVPAAVTVSEDGVSGGQIWSRIYGRKNGFPQVIHSAKQFAGPVGLEEHIGAGVGMALKVSAMAGGLEFRSDHYFLKWFGFRIRLPKWLEPGETVVRHIDAGDLDSRSSFVFSLNLKHPAIGELVHQEGLFHDA